MHIGFNGWFWDQPHSGSGQYLRHLLAHLAKVQPDMSLTLVLPAHASAEDAPQGVKVLHAGAAHSSRLGKVWFEQVAFPRAVEKSGADLAHVPYWGSPLSCRLPLVVSVLDVIPLIYPAYALGAANRLYLSLVQTSAQQADQVITISQTSKLDIEYWLNIPKERISVTYLAADDAFHPRLGREHDEAVRAKYGLPERFVLYLGGYDQRKQLSALLEAYTYLKLTSEANLPLVLAGKKPSFSPPLFPDVDALARELGVDDMLHWVGPIDEADKPSLYRLAEVFAFPSAYEGFGLPPLEALACGTPVVAWDNTINDEILEGAAYLVDSPRNLAAAIIALIGQKPFREAMMNQGLALATRYNWRKTAKHTLQVYESVLKRSSNCSGVWPKEKK